METLNRAARHRCSHCSKHGLQKAHHLATLLEVLGEASSALKCVHFCMQRLRGSTHCAQWLHLEQSLDRRRHSALITEPLAAHRLVQG